MPKINLTDIVDAADKQYSDFEVHLPSGEVILFVPAMRMVKEKRHALAEAMNIPARAESNNGDDLYDVYRDAFKVAEKVPGNYDKLVAAVGDDPAVWQALFMEFNEVTFLGEASSSQK